MTYARVYCCDLLVPLTRRYFIYLTRCTRTPLLPHTIHYLPLPHTRSLAIPFPFLPHPGGCYGSHRYRLPHSGFVLGCYNVHILTLLPHVTDTLRVWVNATAFTYVDYVTCDNHIRLRYVVWLLPRTHVTGCALPARFTYPGYSRLPLIIHLDRAGPHTPRFTTFPYAHTRYGYFACVVPTPLVCYVPVRAVHRCAHVTFVVTLLPICTLTLFDYTRRFPTPQLRVQVYAHRCAHARCYITRTFG